MKQSEFDELRKDVTTVREDVAEMKGMLKQQALSNKDWVARIGLYFCVAWALFKSKIGGA